MIRLVLAALRAHRAQALAVVVLAALVSGLAALLPAYLLAAIERSTAYAVEASPLPERAVTATVELGPGDPATEFDRVVASVRASLERPGLALVAGLRAPGRLSPTGEDTDAGGVPTTLMYRDGMCTHLEIVGSCPDGADEVLIGARLAGLFGLRVGDRVSAADERTEPRPMRVAGLYQVTDPTDPYWVRANPNDDQPVLASIPALVALAASSLSATLEGVVTPALFRDVEPKFTSDAVNEELFALQASGYVVTGSLGVLRDRIIADRRLVAAGVPVAAFQLLLLCWFALGLAVRHAGAGRRPDVGLLKLRGVHPARVAALAVGQSGVPIVAGAVLGAGLAAVLARWLAPRPSGGPELDLPAGAVLVVGAGAAAVALLGSVAVAAVVERRMLREPVVDLLRRVPERRRGWRAGAVEAVVAALAVATVYQVRATSSVDFRTAGLAVFAPLFVALAVALTGTRLLVPVASALARRAFANARLGTGLAVLDMARRPGARGLGALLVVATALLVTAATGWSSAATARSERAGIELGADRVATVLAENNDHLLAAVRAADPGGRFALAAVEGHAGSEATGPAVLAVDASRLAAVGRWPDGAGRPADLAAALRPPGGRPAVHVAGRELELEITAPAQAAQASAAPTIEASFLDARGGLVIAAFEPAPAGRTTVRAATPGCVDGPCRLISLVLRYPGTGPVAVDQPVVLHRLAQRDPAAEVIGTATFADLAFWRRPFWSQRPALVFSRASDGLVLRAVPLPELGQQRPGPPEPYLVELADSPRPLPAVAVGTWSDLNRRAGERPLGLLGGTPVPVRLAPAGTVLPRVGDAGLIVDLEYLNRATPQFGGGVRQVWLTADAPDGLLDRLRAEGLRIVSVSSAAQRAERFTEQGSVAVLQLHLAVALAGLLLAVGSVALVAAVDRPARIAELAALRVQGVPVAAVRRSVAGGYVALVAIAAGLGVFAALLARRLVGAGLPAFNDGWALLPKPPPDPLTLGLLAVGCLVAFGVAVLAAAAPLLRAVRGAR
jgi:putative ABC transport system permease protein